VRRFYYAVTHMRWNIAFFYIQEFYYIFFEYVNCRQNIEAGFHGYYNKNAKCFS